MEMVNQNRFKSKKKKTLLYALTESSPHAHLLYLCRFHRGYPPPPIPPTPPTEETGVLRENPFLLGEEAPGRIQTEPSV